MSHAAALLAFIACLSLYGPQFAERTLALIRGSLRFDRVLTREPAQAMAAAGAAAAEAVWATLPLVIAPIAAATAATLAVGGLVFSLKPAMPDLTRLDPMKGVGKMFSKDSAVDIGKLTAIAMAVGGVGAWYAVGGLAQFAAYAGMSLPSALATAGADLRTGLIGISGVVIAVAVADGPLQIFRHHQKMMMTPQEAKQEYKEAEGDPHVKAKIRERQRAMARGRMLQAVATADVVVTNPTHFAVALKYEEGAMSAPRVVSKGADLLAAKIRELAEEAGVPLLESPPLARALYKHVEVDGEVPAALYSAVAQVLAWVYQINQHLAGRGKRPNEPGIVVPDGMDPLGAER